MAQVLDAILAYKRKEVEAAKAAVSVAILRARARVAPPVRPFAAALRERVETAGCALIAEVKKASPSKGL
ncbi:MAG: indole-3-glycerol phosphate synthase TrpC, partial [Methyloceanibacter sp.]